MCKDSNILIMYTLDLDYKESSQLRCKFELCRWNRRIRKDIYSPKRMISQYFQSIRKVVAFRFQKLPFSEAQVQVFNNFILDDD